MIFRYITAPFVPFAVGRDVQIFEGYIRELFVECEYYSVEKITVESCAEILQEYNFMNVSVIEGSGKVDGRVIKR